MITAKNRRTVTVVQDCKALTGFSFTRNIAVGFDPDECVMKNIAYTNPNAGEGIGILIQSNIMKGGDGIIGLIAPTVAANNLGSAIAPLNQFPIDINAIGSGASSIFNIMNPVIGSTTGAIEGTNGLTAAKGVLVFTLEFIQHEKEKEEKKH